MMGLGTGAAMMWGILFSSIGAGYFLYGKKQGRPVPLISGLALFIYPFFITNSYLIVAVGCVLTAIPYFVRT